MKNGGPIYLKITSSSFNLSSDISFSTSCLTINRNPNSKSLYHLETRDSVKDPYPIYTFDAFLGVAQSIHVKNAFYCIFVNRKSLVGTIEFSQIWRIESVQIFHLYENEPETEDSSLNFLYEVFKTPYFYFSYDYDLTNSIQRRSSPLDLRFLWNIAFEFPPGNFVTNIIHGAIFISLVQINDVSVKWILISRRSRQRVGSRFFVRGVDEEGNVANFVETEQILFVKEQISSFIQIRGSIPLLWTQTPNIRYKPLPILSKTKSETLTIAHYKNTGDIYGSQVVVSLIDSKGGEGVLAKAFSDFHQKSKLPTVQLFEFDFHKEGWNQLYKMTNILKEYLQETGYWTVSSSQLGVVRTNCMDCLDRTNVLQSLIAMENFKNVLSSHGIIFKLSESHNSSFKKTFQNVWADHANIISIQYSGTCALKTDFTRTGLRTTWGKLQDGWTSGIRYVKNNFTDGFRQDALDYFVGNLKFGTLKKKDRLYSFSEVLLLSSLFLCSVLLLSLLLFFGFSSLENCIYSLLLLLILITLFKLLLKNGFDYVDFPTGYHPYSNRFPPIQHGVSYK